MFTRVRGSVVVNSRQVDRRKAHFLNAARVHNRRMVSCSCSIVELVSVARQAEASNGVVVSAGAAIRTVRTLPHSGLVES